MNMNIVMPPSNTECTTQIVPRQYGNGYAWPPDILNNQYAQPVKDTKYTTRGIPSIYTNVGFVNTAYRQVGILNPHEDVNSVRSELLILMGRPLYVNRNKWQYYAITDQRNELKLNIRTKGKVGTNEYGVDELYTKDKVFVQGYNKCFIVDLYENDYIQYNQYL